MQDLLLDRYLYRCYDDLTILYDKSNLNYVVFEDVYSEFFKLYFLDGMSENKIAEVILGNYEVNKQDVLIDLKEFLCEFYEIYNTTCNNINNTKRNYFSEQYIYNLVSQRFIPFTATIEVTDSCNLNCIHCYRENDKLSSWNVYNFKKLLKNLKELGTMHIVLTGSEIFMHKDIRVFIKMIIDVGFVLTMQTNGTLLKEKDIELLSTAIIRKIYISLYSGNEKIHDRITSVKGSFKLTLDSLKKLKHKKIPLGVNCPVMLQNKDSVKETKEFCEKLGVECNFSFKIIPSQNPNKNTEKFNCYTEDYIYDLVMDDNVKLYRKEINKIVNSKKTVPHKYCQTGFRSITLDYDGEVLICNAYRKKCGNINNMDLNNIWYNSKVLNEWRNVVSSVNKKCKHCDAYNFCEPCPAHTYTKYKRDDAIDDITCNFGKIFYSVASKYINQKSKIL